MWRRALGPCYLAVVMCSESATSLGAMLLCLVLWARVRQTSPDGMGWAATPSLLSLKWLLMITFKKSTGTQKNKDSANVRQLCWQVSLPRNPMEYKNGFTKCKPGESIRQGQLQTTATFSDKLQQFYLTDFHIVTASSCQQISVEFKSCAFGRKRKGLEQQVTIQSTTVKAREAV